MLMGIDQNIKDNKNETWEIINIVGNISKSDDVKYYSNNNGI